MPYGVCGGPRAGVYDSWDEAKKCSIGIKGALCKKFPDRASAEAFAFPGGAGKTSCPAASVEATGQVAIPLQATPARASSSQPPPPVDAAGRIYLKVPYDEKDEAKALGAKWDPARKKWYAASTGDFARLTKWPVAREDSPVPSRPAQVDKVPSPFLPADERKALAAMHLDELSLYTDGSCIGNMKVAEKSCPAGWGVAVVGAGGHLGEGLLVAELFGPVILDPTSEFFLGAEVGSNNTGELCGICEALLWLRDWEPSTRPAAICYDSQYAAKTTSGDFKANKNKQLVQCARSLLAEVKRKRKVSMKHVKGHSGHKWNESVDRLAKRGAAGERCTEGRWRPGRRNKRAAPDESCAEGRGEAEPAKEGTLSPPADAATAAELPLAKRPCVIVV